MKRLIPALAILLVIIIICVVSYISVCRTIKKAKLEIIECETLYKSQEFSKAYDRALRFKKKWKKASSGVSIYSSHCILDDISVFSAILPEAVKAKNDFEVNSTLNQIKVSLDRILEEQSLTVKSLY